MINNPPTRQGRIMLFARSKRGQFFGISLVLFTLFFLIYLYVVLMSRQNRTTEHGHVGGLAIAAMSVPAENDRIAVFIDQAAGIAGSQAISELARRGGMGETDTCGITNGYSLWNTFTKNLNQCRPDTRAGLITHFDAAFRAILAGYKDPDGRAIELSRHFDHSIIDAQSGSPRMTIITTAPTPLRIPIKAGPDPADTIISSSYLGATTRQPNILTDFQSLHDGAQKIIKACADTTDQYTCAQDQAAALSSAPGATLQWQAAPCIGDIAPTDPRIILFCVRSKQRALSQRSIGAGKQWEYQPTTYKFGLTLTQPRTITITQFQANGVPTSGNPTDRGGLGLAPGSPISYTGKVAAPDTTGLTISLCYTPDNGDGRPENKQTGIKATGTQTCQRIEQSSWGTANLRTAGHIEVSGTTQPPINPPYILTLKAAAKDQTDETAGIDILASKNLI